MPGKRRQALEVLDAAERALPSSSSRALPLTYVGPGANTHGLCRQIITPDLNQVGDSACCGQRPAINPNTRGVCACVRAWVR